MKIDSKNRQDVNRPYFRSHHDPNTNARDITAAWMMRDGDTHPAEPLRIALDYTAISRMGWQSGDPITLIAVGPERSHPWGGLVIRKARSGESAYILDESDTHFAPGSILSSAQKTYAPDFSWGFPTRWVEAFFPGDYDREEHRLDTQTERRWSLADVVERPGELVLPLGPDYLFLLLGRDSPTPTTLDLHLIPGLLHLQGWTPTTPLVLESSTDFDPFAAEDVLTIRENCLGEEPNLAPMSDRLAVEVNPLWLDRFFPVRSDAPPGEDPDDSGMLIAPGPQHASQLGRHDDVVVASRQMNWSGYSLSFRLALPDPN